MYKKASQQHRPGPVVNNREEEYLVFLYSNGEKNAVYFNIKEGEHREIPKSKFPEALDEPIGLRVGNYFLIIGGRSSIPSDSLARFLGDFNNAGWKKEGNKATRIWAIRKQKWLDGPELPIDYQTIKTKV